MKIAWQGFALVFTAILFTGCGSRTVIKEERVVEPRTTVIKEEPVVPRETDVHHHY